MSSSRQKRKEKDSKTNSHDFPYRIKKKNKENPFEYERVYTLKIG